MTAGLEAHGQYNIAKQARSIRWVEGFCAQALDGDRERFGSMSIPWRRSGVLEHRLCFITTYSKL